MAGQKVTPKNNQIELYFRKQRAQNYMNHQEEMGH